MKIPAIQFEMRSAADGVNTTTPTPREHHLFKVLAERGWTSRHDLDRLIGAENTPDVVMRARRRLGLDIPMVKRSFTDRDGRKVRVGFYTLSEADIAKLPSKEVA